MSSDDSDHLVSFKNIVHSSYKEVPLSLIELLASLKLLQCKDRSRFFAELDEGNAVAQIEGI